MWYSLFKIFPNFFVLYFGFLYSCADRGTEPKDISLKQAEEIVLNKLLNGTKSGKIVYELLTKVKAGSAIYSVDAKYTAPTDSWFFFIDDMPGYFYAHPCRYVFICCASGNQTVYSGDYLYKPIIFNNLIVVKF